MLRSLPPGPRAAVPLACAPTAVCLCMRAHWLMIPCLVSVNFPQQKVSLLHHGGHQRSFTPDDDSAPGFRKPRVGSSNAQLALPSPPAARQKCQQREQQPAMVKGHSGGSVRAAAALGTSKPALHGALEPATLPKRPAELANSPNTRRCTRRPRSVERSLVPLPSSSLGPTCPAPTSFPSSQSAQAAPGQAVGTEYGIPPSAIQGASPRGAEEQDSAPVVFPSSCLPRAPSPCSQTRSTWRRGGSHGASRGCGPLQQADGELSCLEAGAPGRGGLDLKPRKVSTPTWQPPSAPHPPARPCSTSTRGLAAVWPPTSTPTHT